VSRNRLDCYEEPGKPNAHTTVELVDSRGDHGLYRLTPHTGKTHQLRVHMNSLGTNLVGDPLYPVVAEDSPDHPEDPQRTLQLLAAQLSFPPPHQADAGSPPADACHPAALHDSGTRVYRSERTLHWPDGTPAPHHRYLPPMKGS
ncbi:pseudouridine synthase, partial [Lawsonella clevelandensis]